jgi:hypothetical protein
VQYIIVTVIIGLIIYLIQINDPNNVFLIPKIWVIFIFLATITIIAYLISFFGIKMGGEGSVLIIMGPMILKLLFSLAFVVVYLQKFRVNGIHFALEFFSLYFLFTAFEIYSLLCNLRDQNKNVKSPNK